PGSSAAPGVADGQDDADLLAVEVSAAVDHVRCVLEAVVDPAVSLAPPEPAFADLRGLYADGAPARKVREQVEVTANAQDFV
ncbi:hypothetical protein ACWCO3_34510, partial [Micromonospora sp. NPDC002411]